MYFTELREGRWFMGGINTELHHREMHGGTVQTTSHWAPESSNFFDFISS